VPSPRFALGLLLVSALGGCDRAAARPSAAGHADAAASPEQPSAPASAAPQASASAGGAANAADTAAASGSAAVSAPGSPLEPARGAAASSGLPRPEAAPPSRNEAPGDRIHAKARHVWIQPAPQPTKGWLGYLTLGGSVRLFEGSAEKAKTYGPGCDAWYRVEPMGYVCLGPETTLDANDPELVRLRASAAKIDEPYPFDYAESIGAPRYVGLPTAKQITKAEWDLADHRTRLDLLREG
jgi:hypothetical protein